MRFRKSVTLCKGVKLNASKSGVSFTVGGKGISLNLGKKGVFLNTSLPGTGLYDRKRIDTLITDKLGLNKKNKKTKAAQKEEELPDFTMTLTENGEMRIENENGRAITDEALLRRIRQTDEYQVTYNELMDAYAQQLSDATEAFTHIYLLSADVSPAGQHRAARIIQAKEAIAFEEPKPTHESILPALEAAADAEAARFPFYARKLKKRQYVQEQMDVFYARALDEWEARKNAWEEEQSPEAAVSLPHTLSESTSPLQIEQQIEQWLATLELPVDFSLQFDYDENKGLLWVDLDLPEIEDIPEVKAVELKSGQVKAKEKTQKELRQDYVSCVFGLAVFFASYLFCISPKIGQQVISGYTQRRNERSGETEDRYVYSVVFDRSTFEKGAHKKEEPYTFCQRFRNRVNLLATSELKAIEPYTPKDIL